MHPDDVVAIVDYGMGNLMSVKSACEHVGVYAVLTDDPETVAHARGVILPGVGAFGDAMSNLEATGLADAVRSAAANGTVVFGVCLGMQLLMSESEEFGPHRGLDVISGTVVALPRRTAGGDVVRVPHIGWSRLSRVEGVTWDGTAIGHVTPDDFVYFVHSYYVSPEDASVVVSMTHYGGTDFCSTIQSQNVFACQYHPERSGPAGLSIYERLFSTHT